jgi:predicted lipid-binding transport protein (Tim44 family)
VPRLAFALAGLALIALAGADLALAQAGSGSSGFGGGGGGGGSSFGGGSSGGGSGGGSPVVVVIFFAIFGLIWLLVLNHARKYRKKVRERDARVRSASAEAAEDDAYFAADQVEAAARQLFLDAQVAWDARDRAALARLVGADLLVEWERRLDDFEAKGWHNRVQVLDTPKIEYVGIVNREDDTEDRAVARISASLTSYVEDRGGNKIMKDGKSSTTISLCEYWTLARRDDGWTVVSIEARAEGDHHLDSEIVASPWSDEQRLADESLAELAGADAVPEGFTTADLATIEFDGDARAHALDLSLADARFAPDLLEAAARRATEAWATAVDGPDEELERVASPEAVGELLYGGDASRRTRLVVRGPRVKRIAIVAVDMQSQPARMTIEVEVHGRRYVEDRDTAALLSGSRDRATTFGERWTLALDGPDENPWRLVATGAAAAA